MIKLKLFIILLFILIISCTKNQEKEKSFSISEIKVENSTPSVDIEKYSLIENSSEDLRSDASEILKLKRRWPLAMQSQNSEEFDSILSKNFTFKGTSEFFNRKDYIENRIKPNDWKITFVKYDNVCLEFINESLAILSYKNKIKNVNSKTQEIEFEVISWTDIYVKEKNKWKIKSAHAIDYRIEE